MKRFVLVFGIASGLTAFIFVNGTSYKLNQTNRAEAGKAMSAWHAQRAYPGTKIDMSFYSGAFAKLQQQALNRTSLISGQWEPIGPMNFGGRTLDICLNPLNTNTIYAGSASGGLWRSWSGGMGAQAWQEVATGFPVLGVASIAINPVDTNEIYIGTGEVYDDQNAGTGFAVRLTRGTYGIGILKSTDGGLSWNKSLDWQYDELKGVQDLLINPLRPQTVFAATTEGTFRSYDSGGTWTLVHSVRMVTDLNMMPNDTSKLIIACGNGSSPNSGIYRSTNGGTTFTQVTFGLPASWTGKAMLDISQQNPQVIFASIADQLSGQGLWRSDDGGTNWIQLTSIDFQMHQGWYSHDVACRPNDDNEVMAVGIDAWKSTDGGFTLNQESYWDLWDFNQIIPGASEGPPDYAHCDIHRVFYHPTNFDIIYLATDGGVFRSLDGGATFEGCNGGYHTQQFYANFSCSTTDSMFSIGGMQDNATAVYEGNPGWRRVIGGDGLCTAIHTTNDQIVYGSYQYLNLEQSTDKAQSFNSLFVPGSGGSPNTLFAGPFILCPSSPATLYAGRTVVFKSIDDGLNWNATNNNLMLDSNAVLVLACDPNNENTVYASTAPVAVPMPGLFKTTDGGNNWTNVVAGLPNRYLMDVAVHPSNPDTVFVTAGGFGTPHVFRSINGGTTWTASAQGIPDVPVNSILFDPLNPRIMYLGCDIGVYYSIDGGTNWNPFNEGLIDATLVMDISISPSNRKLRLATHGKGVYERDMLPVNTSTIEIVSNIGISVFPNPASQSVWVDCTNYTKSANFQMFDEKGALVMSGKMNQSKSKINVSELPSGIYFIKIFESSLSGATRFVKM